MQCHHALRLLAFANAARARFQILITGAQFKTTHNVRRWQRRCGGECHWRSDRRRATGRLPFVLLRLRRGPARVRSFGAGIESRGQLAAFSAYIASAGNGGGTTRPRVRPRAAFGRGHLDGVRRQLGRTRNKNARAFLAGVYGRQPARHDELRETPTSISICDGSRSETSAGRQTIGGSPSRTPTVDKDRLIRRTELCSVARAEH